MAETLNAIYAGLLFGPKHSDRNLTSLDFISAYLTGNRQLPPFESLAVLCSSCEKPTAALTETCYNNTLQYSSESTEEEKYCHISPLCGLKVNTRSISENRNGEVACSGYSGTC